MRLLKIEEFFGCKTEFRGDDVILSFEVQWLLLQLHVDHGDQGREVVGLAVVGQNLAERADERGAAVHIPVIGINTYEPQAHSKKVTGQLKVPKSRFKPKSESVRIRKGQNWKVSESKASELESVKI